MYRMICIAAASGRQHAPFVALTLTLGVSGFLPAIAQSPPGDPNPGDPKATEQWEPVPPVVSPGTAAGSPPSDAIILFDGRNLDQWVATKDHSPARWKVGNGILTVDKALGNIETKQLFRNYQLHLEWRIPKDITGEGQLRGNSGLFLASTGPGDTGYEVQILDSWKNQTYVNGQAASIYKQAPPLVNAMRAPGEWQTYDVVWTAPIFEADGSLRSPAYVTVFHNGVLVQNHVTLSGETVYIGKPAYRPYQRAAIKLQAHGDPSAPISFRNIWVRELGDSVNESNK
jgi:Domain of Unknown Function (DUF1080)